MDHKYCAVPLCQNTSLCRPQKLFIRVPLNIKRRNLWLRLAKRNPKKFAGNTKIYFCEDHFDLKNDMVNYAKYETGVSKKVELVPGCIPTKFKCQMSRKMAQMSHTIQLPTIKLLDLTEEHKKQTEVTANDTQCPVGSTEKQSTNIQEEKIDPASRRPLPQRRLSERLEEIKTLTEIRGTSEKIDTVFSSDITRRDYIQANCLYDLLKIIPADPVKTNKPQSATCEFTPKTDKYYIPKKKSRLKVKTVRSIRKEIEEDVYSYLPRALEKQKITLLKKIMDGSAKSETTQMMAKNMLNSDQPILRSCWQMLTNINPENQIHSKQFVLWNGKCIQVNGSKGGRNKFICNYDLGRPRLKRHIATKKKMPNKRKGLLQHSLAVKFKPGPLARKKYLDDSHQKYHVGITELVNVPKPGLEIQPFYGMTLESGIAKFINSLREENGAISEKWAEFAITMLGTIKKSDAVQNNPDTVITFDLNYRCRQHRILMRRDIQDVQNKLKIQDDNCFTPNYVLDDSIITSEIKDMMEKILDSVEISLEQDNMYSGEDEPRDTICDRPVNIYNHKDKIKRRFCELGRLDVTVIRLPGNNQTDEKRMCNNLFCTLGCICPSLECSYNLKTHCGLVTCMFQCTCDFSRYMDINIVKNGCSDFIPGLLNLDSEINLKLAKEEQKFRQTVIVSGEKSILLKTRKRNWKASKKYGDFYTSLNLKVNKKAELVLSVVDLNLNCQDIEPWCMIHNLYKCFCKGRFTETCVSDYNEDTVQNTETVEALPINTQLVGINDDVNSNTFKGESVNTETHTINTRSKLYCTNKNALPDNPYHHVKGSCTRVNIYQGRKYTDGYYKNTNNKIKEMEQNDSKLRKRIMSIVNNSEAEIKTRSEKHSSFDSATVVDVENNDITPEQTSSRSRKPHYEGPNKAKLVAWLESSYKLYKERMSQGISKTSLEPPVLGKLALYTWEFISKRYNQRKNFFMVSKKSPFRLFIAVDGKSNFFENCININNIELADLHKFPVTVKNLLTSTFDSQDNFCILCGWTDCWEIIGSVSKVDDQSQTSNVDENDFTSKDLFSSSTEIELLDHKKKTSKNPQTNVNLKRQLSSDSSKWFVMTVENDFSEIQFHTRGFFVTYSSIIKAINVARGTGKTVRLSSQKCAERGSGPQFGIYAIPDAKEYCVFVGPYEVHEPLGIETVINTFYMKKDKKTRGVWITTDKVDNVKVIDNPLSYMPYSHLDSNDMVDLDTNNDSMANTNTDYPECSLIQTNNIQIGSNNEISDVTKTQTKVLKPIKIRKTQDFYHIASNGALKKIFFKTPKKQEEQNSPMYFLSSASTSFDKNVSESSNRTNSLSSDTNEGDRVSEKFDDVIDLDQGFHALRSPKKSAAEMISAVNSNKKNSIDSKKPERGMFILKPEEINKKVLQKRLSETESSSTKEDETFINEESLDMDIENFLATCVVCQSPEDEVLVISDDENSDQAVREKNSKSVWIQCTNVDNFGWIQGRKNREDLLSFEFPGFKPTDFYEVQEAFSKINQVLKRKIYIPKNFTLNWEVIQSKSKLNNKDNMLSTEQLGPDLVLTKQGIRHKEDLIQGKTSFSIGPLEPCPTDFTIKENTIPTTGSPSTSKTSYFNNLEEQCVTLENESDALWNETLSNKTKILQSLTDVSDETKQDMTDRLKTIMSMSK